MEDIADRIQQILSTHHQPIALHEPYFQGNEWRYVKECIDTGWVSSVGKFVDRFEQDLAAFTGAKYAVATVNGTAAVHITYLLAGVQAQDEVLVPTLTFVGTTNPVVYCGAIPHFFDTEPTHLGIDIPALSDYLRDIVQIKQDHAYNRHTGRRIKALCAMHTLGMPIDLEPLLALCERYKLALVEDAAEALGTYYRGRHVGHHGVAGALSFNGNKVMTTGGGGAILTDHEALAVRAKHLTTTAKLPHAYAFHHDAIGYNYRLPNLNAALGCAQLEQLPEFLIRKRKLHQTYQAGLANFNKLRLISEPSFGKSNFWLNAMVIDQADQQARNQLIQALGQYKIQVRPLWDLQHTLPMFAQCPRMPVPHAEKLFNSLIKLPSSVGLCGG